MTDTASPQFSDDDLFLRDADRERMALAYGALLTKRQSLLLASSSDVLLEHYGKILVQQLRRQDGVQVEVYFPSSSEALIQRFNDVLAPMSLEDAVSTHGPSLPARILVLHDARSVQTAQLELLARLVNDFPGANVRVVLLINTHSQLEKDLTSFGKRMSRWTIDMPDVDGGQAFLRQATLVGLEQQATVLLERLGLMGQDDSLLPDDTVDFAQRDPVAEHALLQAVAQHAQGPGSAAKAVKRGAHNKWLLVATVLLLLVSAAAVVGLSDKYRQVTLQALQSWRAQLNAVVFAPDATPSAELAQAPSAVVSEDASTRMAAALKADEPIDPQPLAPAADQPPEQAADQSPLPTAQLPAQPQEVPPAALIVPQPSALEAPIMPASTPVVDPAWTNARTDLQLEIVQRSLQAQAGTVPLASDRFEPVAPAATPAPAVSATAVPDTTPDVAAAPEALTLPNGNTWVQQLPPTNWLIQYVSVSDQAQADQWILDRPRLTGLKALAMVKRGSKQRHYVVVQGPHTTKARAQAFASRAESPKEYWIRTARSVRGDMVQP